MLPDIGLLIAAYVFTRMAALICRPIEASAGWRKAGQVIVRIFAAVTMLVAIVVGIDLLLRGVTGVSLPELTR